MRLDALAPQAALLALSLRAAWEVLLVVPPLAHPSLLLEQ